MRTLLLFALAASAAAQVRWPNELTLWFPDGTGIDIHTETSGGSAPASTTGSIAAWANDSHRVVLGRNGEILFAYDIEARRSREGGFLLWIKPSRDAQRLYGHPVPTIAAMRDFSPLRTGDAVQVDILYNPATKEKIYDVLQVLGPRPADTTVAKSRQEFVLQDVRVLINGHSVVTRKGLHISGHGVKLELPDRGVFFLTFPPAPNFPDFQPAAWVDHDTLRLHAGNDLIEVISAGSIIPGADFGTVWVHHEPESDYLARLNAQKQLLSGIYTQNHPDVIALQALIKEMSVVRGMKLQCGDDVESLLKGKEVILDIPLRPPQ